MRLAVLLTIVVAMVAVVFILGSAANTNNTNQNTNTSTGTSTATSTDQNIGPKEITIMMSDQNGSSQMGTAKITEIDGRAKVTLQLAGGPNNISQPAHIHDGTCQIPGNIKYPLTTMRNGSSETILPISLAGLISQLPLAADIHKSLSEDVGMSCGDIRVNL